MELAGRGRLLQTVLRLPVLIPDPSDAVIQSMVAKDLGRKACEQRESHYKLDACASCGNALRSMGANDRVHLFVPVHELVLGHG